ncbi:MAG: multidrug efflux SMR transporter [Cardiobacteriaceae bacterium]|nr:multidrug efflux SMR transporter [Cardiobacteriaceae bacterium]
MGIFSRKNSGTTLNFFFISGTTQTGKRMSWLILLVAGLLEIIWAVALKFSDGFSRILPSLITVIAYLLSLLLLGISLKNLPLGIAYSIWVAIGILGVAVCGGIFFAENVNVFKIIGTVFILIRNNFFENFRCLKVYTNMQNLMSVEKLKNNLEEMGKDISTPMFIASEDEINYVFLERNS